MITPATLAPKPEIGDSAPNFHLPDETGRPFVLRADRVAGRPVLLAFSPIEPEEAALRAFGEAAAELKDRGAVALLIRSAPPPENAALLARLELPIGAISDPEGRLREAYASTVRPGPASCCSAPISASRRWRAGLRRSSSGCARRPRGVRRRSPRRIRRCWWCRRR